MRRLCLRLTPPLPTRPSLGCCILVQSGCVRVYARSPVCRRDLCLEFGRRTVRCSLPGKRCRQQEVNSSGAFRQIFGLQGVTVLFGASGGGGCAAGGPAPAPRSSQKPGVLVPILAVRGGGGRVQPWLSGSRQVRDSGPAYSAFFSPHSTKCGAGGQFWGGDWPARGLVEGWGGSGSSVRLPRRPPQ